MVVATTADNLPYEKIGKNEPVCIADEVPFEIPEGWEWVRWGTLSESIQYGYNAPAKENGRIKMVRISDIQDNSVVWQTVPYCEIDEKDIDTYLLKSNDILFARTGGTVGKSYLVKVVPEDAIYAGYLIRTRYSALLCPEFLKYFMETELYWSQLRNGTIATAQPNCNGKTLAHMLVPLPPQNEQKRIVKKLDKIMAYVVQYNNVYNYTEKLNEEFPELLKKSILQEAVQGKLVPQDPSDEPASVLLERIRAEKERLIQEGKIKRDKHESVIFRRDNSHYEKRGSEEVCIDEYLPFELPNNWQWERLINLYNFIDYRGSTPTKIDTGVPLITAKNVKKGYIDYKIRDYISEEEYCTRQSRGISQRGDILFTTEAPLGNVALADLDQFSAGQRLITLQQYTTYPLINNNLVMYFMLSDCFQSQLIEQSTGTTVKGIKADKLKQLWIPVPPLQEQVRILAQLRKVLEACIAL